MQQINGGLTSFYQVNFKRNYLQATPGVEPRSTDFQAVDVDLLIH